jgi:CO/xanthine dehydrogenase Mo-binding subunit
VIRTDALPKTRGAVPYAPDVELPGMLWAVYVTSPHPHAEIRGLSTARAREVPGVVDILTAEDLPGLLHREPEPGRPLLATRETRFVGEPVAVVAAESLPAAREGASRVSVDYRVLPAFTDLEREFPHWPTPEEMRDHPQVNAHVHARRGDFDAVARTADHVHRELYQTAMVAQVPLEPHACVARVQGDDWYVLTTTQTPFGIREDLADKLGLPQERVRVEGTWVGGGFGGKNEALLEPHALLLSRRTGRPVRIALTFQEEFLFSRTTQPALFWMESCLKDGRLVARRTRLLLDTGASLPGRDFALGYSLGFTLGPYRLDTFELEGYALRTHRPPFGPHRAPLAPQCTFASECHLDSLARQRGEDPVEFRLRHVWRPGDRTALGQPVGPFAAEAGLRRAQATVQAWRASAPPGHGVGVALGFWSTGTGAGGEARLTLSPQGLVLLQGEREIGNGSIWQGLPGVAATTLGIPPEAVEVRYGDTGHAPFDSGVWGSRTTAALGYAVAKAAEALRGELARRAPGSGPVTLGTREGRLTVTREGRTWPATELLTPEERSGGGLSVEGKHYGKNEGTLEDGLVLEGEMFPYADLIASVHVAEVSVDRETGAVRVVRYAAFQDAGKVVNPEGYRGQVEGGIVMGLGTALTEEGMLDPGGRLSNPGLLDYRIPTLSDPPPELTVVALEGSLGSGVWGSKGVGEPPIIPVPAAVANAVADATKARVRVLPLTPERVSQALGLLSPRDPGGRW